MGRWEQLRPPVPGSRGGSGKLLGIQGAAGMRRAGFEGIFANSGPVVGSGWFSQCGMIPLDLFPAKPKEGAAGKAGEERFWWEFRDFCGLQEERSEVVFGGQQDSCSWDFFGFFFGICRSKTVNLC